MGGVYNLPMGNSGSGSSGGGGGRYPTDGRGSAGGNNKNDPGLVEWLRRNSNLPPGIPAGRPSHQQQQQPTQQRFLEEFISSFARSGANVNALLAPGVLEALLACSQQQQSQGVPAPSSASRTRSPAIVGMPRPSSGSLAGLPGQASSLRPGSATMVTSFGGGGGGGGGVRGAGGRVHTYHGQNQALPSTSSIPQLLPEQLTALVAAANAAGVYSPSSSTTSSSPSTVAHSRTPSSNGVYGQQTQSRQLHPPPTPISSSSSTAHLQQVYAAAAAAAHLGQQHTDALQDLARGQAFQGSSSNQPGVPATKRARLISGSGSAPTQLSYTASPSPSTAPTGSSSASRQQQDLLMSRQAAAQFLQNSGITNPAAFLALLTQAQPPQQQQQQTMQAQQQGVSANAAATTARTVVTSTVPLPPPSTSAGFYGVSQDPYSRSSGSQSRLSGSQLLVSSSSVVAAAYGKVMAATFQQQQQQQHQQAAAAVAQAYQGVVRGATSGTPNYRQPQQVITAAPSSSGYHHQPLSHQVASTSQQPSHTGGGSGVLRQQTKEPAYHPQVEAISPAPEEVRLLDAVDIQLQREREDVQQRLHDIEARINKEEGQLRYLADRESSLTADLTNEGVVVAGRSKRLSAMDLGDRAYENPIQVFLVETRSRARRQHAGLKRLCGGRVSASACALPLYRRPSDLPALQRLQEDYKSGFRCKLIRYIHRRKCAEKARLRILAKQYSNHAQIFFKRHEKNVGSAKRKQKDAKNRDIFEKTFPEVKKNRVDQDRDAGKTDDGQESNSNAGSSGADCDQGEDGPKEIVKLREYAIDPPVILAPWERAYHFHCTTRLVTDPKAQHVAAQSLQRWTDTDRARFKERFLATPKNFTAIADSLDKTVAECIHYYYLSKKQEEYKALVKKQHSTSGGGSRRRRGGHSDKNGPTGPSHGTASRKAPSRVSTPIGEDHRNSPYADDGHTATHRKSAGGGTRGRSGRRGGGCGDYRSGKGNKGGRSGTPIPSSSTAAFTSQQPSLDLGLEVVDRRSGVALKLEEDYKPFITAALKLEDSATATYLPMDKETGGLLPITTDVYPPTKASRTPSALSQAQQQYLSDPTNSPAHSSTRGAPVQPPPSVVEIINLTLGSPPALYSSEPNVSQQLQPAHPPKPAVFSSSSSGRPVPYTDSNITAVAAARDVVSALTRSANLSEQLAILTKAGNLSPELLATFNLPQLAAAAAALTSPPPPQPPPSSSRKQSRPDRALDGPKSPSRNALNESGATVAATTVTYNKASLIGDYCTAQQLSRGATSSQQQLQPTTASITGTTLQRAADFSDPMYLSSRALDPSLLPLPPKRGVEPPRSASSSNLQSSSSSTHGPQPPPSNITGATSNPTKSSSSYPHPHHRQNSRMEGGSSRQSPGRAPVSNHGQQAGHGDAPPPPPLPPPSHPMPRIVPTYYPISSGNSPKDDTKVQAFVNQAERVYHEEVELYTSRDRSDSMRTRTSSETSQQIHAVLDQLRQQRSGFIAGVGGGRNGGGGVGFSGAPPSYPPELNDIPYGSQYLPLIAAAAAAASSNGSLSTSAPTTAATSRPDSSAAPLPPPPQYSSMSPGGDHHHHPPPQPPQQHEAVPRYRKTAAGTTPSSTFNHPPLLPPPPPPREIFGPRGHHQGRHIHLEDGHPAYPTLMRASGTTNVASVGLTSEELERKSAPALTSVRNPQPIAPPPVTTAMSIVSAGVRTPETRLSVGPHPPYPAYHHKTSSAARAPSGAAATDVTTTTSSVADSSSFSSVGTNAATKGSTTFIVVSALSGQRSPSAGTLGDQIEKAISDSISVQTGHQETPKINPSTAEAKSVMTVRPSSILVTSDAKSEEYDMTPFLTAAIDVRASSVLVQSGPPTSNPSTTTTSTTSKKRSLGNSTSSSHEPLLPSPASPCDGTGVTSSAGSCVSGPSSKPIATSASSPHSSLGSPGNLQICLPTEEESLQQSPGHHQSTTADAQSPVSADPLATAGDISTTAATIPDSVSGEPQSSPPVADSH